MLVSDISNNKRIAKNTLLLYFRMLISMIVGLYTSRVVLATLGVDDYGLYNVVGGIVVTLSFLNGAMATSTQRYMNVEMGKQDKEGLRKVFGSSLVIHAIAAAAIVILAEALGVWFLNNHMNIAPDRLEAANWVYQFSIASFAVTVLSVPFNAAIIAHERMSAFAYISIIEVTLKLVVAIVIGYAPFDKLIFYALLVFIVALMVRISYGTYCKRHFEECRCVKFKVDKSLLRNMMSFSSWAIMGNLAYVFHTQGLGIVFNIFFGTTVNAAHGVSNQVNTVVSGFVQNFMTAAKPQIVKNYASGNLQDMHKLMMISCRFAFFLVMIFVVPIVLETPYLLSLWLEEVPMYTEIFVRLLLLTTLFDSFNSLLYTVKGATGDIKTFMIVLTCISFMHLPLTWLLFELGFEPYYAMVVYLLLVIVMQVVRIGFVCKAVALPVRVFYTEVVRRCVCALLVAFIPTAILYYILPKNIGTVFSVCLIGALFSNISIMGLGLKKQERVALWKIALNKLKLKK